MSPLLQLPAPAKINLFLHVVGRRADGYHLLQSVFVLLDWCDHIDLHPRADGQIHRHDRGLPLPDDDLCLRAARLLQSRSGTAMGCDIHIDKQLPWGAGLGGGSSNAATVLLGLNRLWGLHWSPSQLADLGLALGADVPFFVHGHNAWVEGVGERITPLDLPEQVFTTPLSVIKPQVNIPTPAIFTSPLLRRDTPLAPLAGFMADPLHFGHNDLQPPAEAHAPEVTQAVATMHAALGNARMSGSGSAVFGWHERRDARAVDDLLHNTQKCAWQLRTTHVLRHHPVLDLFDASSAM